VWDEKAIRKAGARKSLGHAASRNGRDVKFVAIDVTRSSWGTASEETLFKADHGEGRRDASGGDGCDFGLVEPTLSFAIGARR
jgi:hypothetical protein